MPGQVLLLVRLIRPVGGMIADKFGGAWVTHICSFVMVISAGGSCLLYEGGIQLGHT